MSVVNQKTQQGICSKLARLFPNTPTYLITGLLNRLSDHCLIAGGSMLYALDVVTEPEKVGDIDLFLLKTNDQIDMTKQIIDHFLQLFGADNLNFFVVPVNKQIDDSDSDQEIELDSEQTAEPKPKSESVTTNYSKTNEYIENFRNGHLENLPDNSLPCSMITIELKNEPVSFQLILSPVDQPLKILQSFDFDYVQVGYFNGELFQTPEAKEAHQTKSINVLRFPNHNMVKRSAKAIYKGFQIPGFTWKGIQGELNNVSTNTCPWSKISSDYLSLIDWIPFSGGSFYNLDFHYHDSMFKVENLVVSQIVPSNNLNRHYLNDHLPTCYHAIFHVIDSANPDKHIPCRDLIIRANIVDWFPKDCFHVGRKIPLFSEQDQYLTQIFDKICQGSFYNDDIQKSHPIGPCLLVITGLFWTNDFVYKSRRLRRYSDDDSYKNLGFRGYVKRIIPLTDPEAKKYLPIPFAHQTTVIDQNGYLKIVNCPQRVDYLRGEITMPIVDCLEHYMLETKYQTHPNISDGYAYDLAEDSF